MRTRSRYLPHFLRRLVGRKFVGDDHAGQVFSHVVRSIPTTRYALGDLFVEASPSDDRSTQTELLLYPALEL